MSELCVETLWYGGQTDDIARQLNLCYIFIFKKSSKLYIHYQIALNTPLQGKEFFVSMPKNLAWIQQQVDSI
jgi:hypothetical protein